MPQITAFEPQKRKQGRFNIFVDGKFAFGVDEKTLAEENLQVGKKLRPEEIEEIIAKAGIEKILQKVYRYLSFRPRSKKEIEEYLKRKNLGEDEKRIIVKKLEKAGFVSDLEFARFFVESRLKFRPKGKRLMAVELAQKGIDKNLIEETLAEINLSETDLALKSIEKKLPRFLKLPELEAKLKISQFLARRGFNWETIKVIIDRSLKTR